MKDALLPKAYGLNVPAAIKDGKRIAVKKHARPVVRKGG
jgi:hypothetical protein